MERGQLFVEVFCEELPAGWGRSARGALATALQDLLEGIPTGEVRTWSTPRRIAVAIDDVAFARPVKERVIKGPPADRAFQDGKPTRVATGFARGRGVAVEDLEFMDSPRGRVVAARVREGGEPTRQLLAEGLEAAILGVPFPRTMRWGEGRYGWARPVHRVCALLGGDVIRSRVAGVVTDRVCEGHRMRSEPFTVTDAASWADGLRNRWVMVDEQERRRRILEELQRVAGDHGVAPMAPDDLLEEVADLVEWPEVVAARLAPRFLELPPRLLVETMKVHQRVFPTVDDDGDLTPLFLAVSNNPRGDADLIAAGNTRVLTARFEDARFFYEEDRRRSLEQHAEPLKRMQWVRGLGTMAHKTERLRRLARSLAPRLSASPEHAARAAALCKADLTTEMVGEFPKLQGHVGHLYARHQGEPEPVARAIEEHYLPRFAGDELPRSREGRALALADRVDTLTGCFLMGLEPRGNADPQGLRRAANGLLQLLVESELSLSLRHLLDEGIAAYPDRYELDPDTAGERLVAFVLARFRAARLAEAVPAELIDAVLEAGGDDPVRLLGRIRALDALAAGDGFAPLRTAFRRVMGLTRDHPSAEYDPDALGEPAEQALHRALTTIRDDVHQHVAERRYETALDIMAGLGGPVDDLFDQVLVMDENPQVRANRLGLLRAVADLFRTIADFSRLPADGTS